MSPEDESTCLRAKGPHVYRRREKRDSPAKHVQRDRRSPSIEFQYQCQWRVAGVAGVVDGWMNSIK